MINKNYNKVFCVGSNKTGTTTVEKVLKDLRFKMPSQKDQEKELTRDVSFGNYELFKSLVEEYDAFQDKPFSNGLTFVAADALFPNSRFILTERDPEAWFESLIRFHKKRFGFKDPLEVVEEDVKEFRYLYPGYLHEDARGVITTFEASKRIENWNLFYDKDFRIKLYLERNASIKKYFMNSPEKLLVIDVTSSKDTSKICDFLHFSTTSVIKMPHLNKSLE